MIDLIIILKYALIAVFTYGLMVYQEKKAEGKEEEDVDYLVDTCFAIKAGMKKYSDDYKIPENSEAPYKILNEMKRRNDINSSILKEIKTAKIPQGYGLKLMEIKGLVQITADDIWEKQKGELKDRLSPEDAELLAYKFVLELSRGKPVEILTDDKLIIETEKQLKKTGTIHHKYLIELQKKRKKGEK